MANEKVISPQALIEKFQQALDDLWGYIWGTAGEKWTAAKQEKLDKTTDADRANSRKYGKQWIGHMVADCSGLFSWAFKQLGGYMYHGSNTMYRKYCTANGLLKNGARTDGQGLKPGTAVFCYNETTGKWSHVGLYIGNGWVIEAAGAKSGVILSKVSNSKWEGWGELKGVAYDGTAPDPTPEPEPVNKPTIRKGNRNKYVKECQTMLNKLGYDLGICGIDGDFGTATEKAVKEFQTAHDGPDGRALAIDGVVGPATWWALEQAVDGQKPAPETYTLKITGLTKAQAEEIQMKYGGVIAAE